MEMINDLQRLAKIKETILENCAHDIIQWVLREQYDDLKSLLNELLNLDEMSETEIIEMYESVLDREDVEAYHEEWEAHG
jgi:hypothetical protein